MSAPAVTPSGTRSRTTETESISATPISQTFDAASSLPTTFSTIFSSQTTSPTASPSSTQQSQQPHESTMHLPGTKRGMAIGVAVSIATILIIALLYFSIKYRKRIKQRLNSESVEAGMHNEKSDPVELDARHVCEVGDEVRPRELSTYIEDASKVQELEARAMSLHELDAVEPGKPLGGIEKENDRYLGP